MPAREYRVAVTFEDLRRAGFDAPPPYRRRALRVRLAYEPEDDGAPAIGYYLEARVLGGWVPVALGTSMDDVTAAIRALERAVHAVDPAAKSWLDEWEAYIE